MRSVSALVVLPNLILLQALRSPTKLATVLHWEGFRPMHRGRLLVCQHYKVHRLHASISLKSSCLQWSGSSFPGNIEEIQQPRELINILQKSRKAWPSHCCLGLEYIAVSCVRHSAFCSKRCPDCLVLPSFARSCIVCSLRNLESS